MEIVVALEIDDARSALNKSPQLLKYRKVFREQKLRVTDPEFKKVTKDKEGLRIPLQTDKKSKQHAVVIVGRISEMGIGNEYLTHVGTIYESPPLSNTNCCQAWSAIIFQRSF